MKFVHFYVTNDDEYIAFDDDATESEIQTEFENWLDGAVDYGWYETTEADIPAYILRELTQEG
jgi:hypothetical protein